MIILTYILLAIIIGLIIVFFDDIKFAITSTAPANTQVIFEESDGILWESSKKENSGFSTLTGSMQLVDGFDINGDFC